MFLSIGPASTTGYALFDDDSDLITVGVIKSPNKVENVLVPKGERLYLYKRDLVSVISSLQKEYGIIKAVLYEDFFFSHLNRNGSSLNVSLRAIIEYCCYELNIPCEVVSISQWKKHAASKGNASKKDIKSGVLNMFEVPEKVRVEGTDKKIKTPQDVYDAIGIGSFGIINHKFGKIFS